ncbi:metalloregulator ArsR/SmtB family transcription factor [Vibrio injensis]|uniref:metalloregulator ArsR/SmtB family transcription factor n=1 Tax=Vibrio injensis TaxID=1307414 RepID=UPI00278BE1F8|nr:metalloregulator ArsR/SmtB family transcription factor [Vibrio injensis]
MCDTLTFYKSLAEETRLKSLLLISQHRELCVCDLMTALSLSQPKVSRHLAELRKNGLVIDERRGKWVYYQINPQLPSWMRQILISSLENDRALIEKESQMISRQSCIS